LVLAYRQRMTDVLLEPVKRAAQAGANYTSRSLGIDVAWDVTNQRVAQSMRDRVQRLADDLNVETAKRMRKVMADGLDSGATVREIAESVRQAGQDMSAKRAETIARTETAQSFTEGEVNQWQESGVVEGKVWNTAPNPCPFCAAVKVKYAESIPLGKSFFPRGDSIQSADGKTMTLNFRDIDGPPLHPRCRCGLLPKLRAGLREG
jgi:uncharacterized protein YoaH (UPF0181 family)